MESWFGSDRRLSSVRIRTTDSEMDTWRYGSIDGFRLTLRELHKLDAIPKVSTQTENGLKTFENN